MTWGQQCKKFSEHSLRYLKCILAILALYVLS